MAKQFIHVIWYNSQTFRNPAGSKVQLVLYIRLGLVDERDMCTALGGTINWFPTFSRYLDTGSGCCFIILFFILIGCIVCLKYDPSTEPYSDTVHKNGSAIRNLKLSITTCKS